MDANLLPILLLYGNHRCLFNTDAVKIIIYFILTLFE